MNTEKYNPANDPENNNTDGIDQTPTNDNQELDKINDAVQAAEPSFTLNTDNSSLADDSKEPDGPNIKQ